jgi:glycosyltransferase involved in cell wall biosynthesis
MRIILCSNVYPPCFIGGAELIAHQHAKALQKVGNEVIVFAGDFGGRTKRYECVKTRYDSLDVYRIGLSSVDCRAEYVNFFHRGVEERFYELLDSFSPDVVNMHNIIGLSAGLIHLSRLAGAKTVVTLHDHWGFCPKNTLIDNSGKRCLDYDSCDGCVPDVYLKGGLRIPFRIRKDYIDLQLKEVDAFISPSRYLADAYTEAGFPGERITVSWNGVDVRRFESIRKKREKDSVVRFSFIGHFGEHKGVGVLIEAAKLLGARQRFRVNLVGIGEELERTRRRVEGMGFGEEVKFWGKVAYGKIKDVYQETDVLILPSIWPENHPGTITESMASRTPVIASRIGGIPELVEDGLTGFLVEPGNALELADRMERFITNRELIETLGERAYVRIRHNTFENRIPKIMEVFEAGPVPRKKTGGTHKTVVCAGGGLSKLHTDALRIYTDRMNGSDCSFVMHDWLTEDQIREAAVCWVLDPEGYREAALRMSRYGAALLVPAYDEKLTRFCRQSKKGLFYADAYEAALCLEHLLSLRQ